jgi:hypothetical protein
MFLTSFLQGKGKKAAKNEFILHFIAPGFNPELLIFFSFG